MTENNHSLLFHNKGVPTYYPSNIVGARIVNAMSGVTYDELVGSNVIMCIYLESEVT